MHRYRLLADHRADCFSGSLALRVADRAVFLYGFAKNAKADLTPDELEILVERGAAWLVADDDVIEAAIADDRLKELD